jgi:hypothetical protein
MKYIVEKPSVVPDGALPTCGIYQFGCTLDFLSSVSEQIRKDDRHGPNKEFYLAPLFNDLLFRVVPVEQFIPLGTPEDYEAHLNG